MVTRFTLIASPIVELNIQLMKILVLKLFLPSTKTSLTAIACVAGAWKLWAQEKTGAREDTRGER